MSKMAKFFFLLIVLLLASTMQDCFLAKARPLGDNQGSRASLAARLKLDDADGGGEEAPPSCWDSLAQLQACTGEIILFFLNGETYLGHSCCEAIRTITQHCWPDMMGTLGFTAEEGDILEGYCVSSGEDSPPSPPATPSSGTSKIVANEMLAP